MDDAGGGINNIGTVCLVFLFTLPIAVPFSNYVKVDHKQHIEYISHINNRIVTSFEEKIPKYGMTLHPYLPSYDVYKIVGKDITSCLDVVYKLNSDSLSKYTSHYENIIRHGKFMKRAYASFLIKNIPEDIKSKCIKMYHDGKENNYFGEIYIMPVPLNFNDKTKQYTIAVSDTYMFTQKINNYGIMVVQDQVQSDDFSHDFIYYKYISHEDSNHWLIYVKNN